MTMTDEEALAAVKTIVPTMSQDNMCYLHCYKCNTQKWYYLDSNGCDVHIDAVQCGCGEWLQ